MAKREPKYEPLSRHLSVASLPLTMTFAEISLLVGGLPASAYRYPAWWADDRTHVQARAWLDVGLRVEAVDLDREVVGFAPGQVGGATVTSSTTAYESLYETRSIKQYPTVGPSLVVHWYVDGSVVIEVGAGLGREWMIAYAQVGNREQQTPTVLRLEPR
jgi:hypothetical protein